MNGWIKKSKSKTIEMNSHLGASLGTGAGAGTGETGATTGAGVGTRTGTGTGTGAGAAATGISTGVKASAPTSTKSSGRARESVVVAAEMTANRLIKNIKSAPAAAASVWSTRNTRLSLKRQYLPSCNEARCE